MDPSEDLLKVHDTCKLLGIEQYSPLKFIKVMLQTYEFLQDYAADLSWYDDLPDGFRRNYEKCQDDLGKLLLTLDQETANKLIGKHLDAGNATTL
jgi:hypothetical protein